MYFLIIWILSHQILYFFVENNNYEIQAIDFGLSKMNNYFYKLTDKFYTTPLIADTIWLF